MNDLKLRNGCYVASNLVAYFFLSPLLFFDLFAAMLLYVANMLLYVANNIVFTPFHLRQCMILD